MSDDEAMKMTVAAAARCVKGIRDDLARTGQRTVIFLAVMDDPRGALGIAANLDEDVEVGAAADAIYRKVRDVRDDTSKGGLWPGGVRARDALLREGYLMALDRVSERLGHGDFIDGNHFDDILHEVKSEARGGATS